MRAVAVVGPSWTLKRGQKGDKNSPDGDKKGAKRDKCEHLALRRKLGKHAKEDQNMKYVGSKARFVKQIVPILHGYIGKTRSRRYFEPFVGGANVIAEIQAFGRYGFDTHRPLIELLNHVKGVGDLPETITEDEYNRVRKSPGDYPLWYIGLVGYCATFGAKYFGGYARGFKADGVTPKDMPAEGIRNLKRQAPKLAGIKFSALDFRLLPESITDATIYCDPPYAETTRYAERWDKNDQAAFWDWCRVRARENYVIISEYQAPRDFECIWSAETTTPPSRDEHKTRTEKMFIYKYGRR